jgi:hypothetical protein
MRHGATCSGPVKPPIPVGKGSLGWLCSPSAPLVALPLPWQRMSCHLMCCRHSRDDESQMCSSARECERYGTRSRPLHSLGSTFRVHAWRSYWYNDIASLKGFTDSRFCSRTGLARPCAIIEHDHRLRGVSDRRYPSAAPCRGSLYGELPMDIVTGVLCRTPGRKRRGPLPGASLWLT